MAKILIFSTFLFTQLFLNSQHNVEEKHTIYVASISWHTAIVVPSYSLPDSIWPAEYDYSNVSYLEIGWGDHDFYQHRGFNIWYAIKAVFWPTPSVLHVNPLSEDIENYYPETKVVKMDITDHQLKDLSQYLLEHFKFGEKGKLIPLQDGFYSDSQFFAGRTKYYFPENSNVWAARALKRAGFSLTPIFYQTTACVLKKAGRLKKVEEDG